MNLAGKEENWQICRRSDEDLKHPQYGIVILYLLISVVKWHIYMIHSSLVKLVPARFSKELQFLFKHIFKVFTNSMSGHSMMFALLLRTEWYNFLPSPSWRSSWNWRMFIFDNYNGVQFIPNIIFVSSLNLQSKCQSCL